MMTNTAGNTPSDIGGQPSLVHQIAEAVAHVLRRHETPEPGQFNPNARLIAARPDTKPEPARPATVPDGLSFLERQMHEVHEAISALHERLNYIMTPEGTDSGQGECAAATPTQLCPISGHVASIADMARAARIRIDTLTARVQLP